MSTDTLRDALDDLQTRTLRFAERVAEGLVADRALTELLASCKRARAALSSQEEPPRDELRRAMVRLDQKGAQLDYDGKNEPLAEAITIVLAELRKRLGAAHPHGRPRDE